ncbi:MAG: hypothetical protein ABIQ13_02415 [Pedococcus sp.]
MIAALYLVSCTVIVWFAGVMWTTATQITIATLAVVIGTFLSAALFVRRTTALRTVALRSERRQVETMQRLSVMTESTLEATEQLSARLDAAHTTTVSELAALQHRVNSGQELSLGEQARLREDVTRGFDGLVKSLGIIGRQMRHLDTRLTLAEAGIRAGHAGAADQAREIENALSSLAASHTQLSLRSEAVFSEVRRHMSPEPHENGWSKQ